MEVSIGFNPSDIKPEDECYPAFMAGGMTLKFWALYKRSHVTSQFFRDLLIELSYRFKHMHDLGAEFKPYTNIDEFYQFLCGAGLNRLEHCGTLTVSKAWIVEHWDYFNLNIQKKVTLKYKAMVEVDQFMIVN